MTIQEARENWEYLIRLYGGLAKVEIVYQNLKLIEEMGNKLRITKDYCKTLEGMI